MRKQTAKKVIPTSTVVKGLITGFISYGVLIYFLVLVIMFGINYAISLFPNPDTKILSVSVPLLLGLFIYVLSHAICKLSTVDLFSKCKTDEDNYPEIKNRMTTFFIVLTIVIIILSNALLCVRILNTEASIDIASNQYSQVFSKEFANSLTNKMLADYNMSKTQTIVSNVIIELAIIFGLLSCIPLQQKLILQYNEVKKVDKSVSQKTNTETKKQEPKKVEQKQPKKENKTKKETK